MMIVVGYIAGTAALLAITLMVIYACMGDE